MPFHLTDHVRVCEYSCRQNTEKQQHDVSYCHYFCEKKKKNRRRNKNEPGIVNIREYFLRIRRHSERLAIRSGVRRGEDRVYNDL